MPVSPSVVRVVPSIAPPVTLPSLIAREKSRHRRRVILGVTTAALLIVAGLATWFLTRPRPTPMLARFRTAALTHGDLRRQVRATGHVEAVSTVSVGAEISGRIATVEVDYNANVKAGQVLARFDPIALQAQRAQSAALALAAKSQLAQARFDAEQTRRNGVRDEGLFAQGALTRAEHEAAATNLSLAKSRVEAAEANLAAQQATATVARTNLDHAVIRAPIDGVIITRNIDPGQTVASVLQTPILFTVAADLRKMEVVAAVDEADIAQVAVGQKVTFTVNAYEARVFEGLVTEVRNAAQVVQDVVTYGVVVSVENADLALKPSMTASVRILTGSASDVDAVANASLRFVPPGQAAQNDPGVWIIESNQLVRKTVQTGLSDGELTQVAPGNLAPGTLTIVDLTAQGKKAYDLGPAK